MQSEFEAVMTDLINVQGLAYAPASQESDTAQSDAALAEAQKTVALLKSKLEKSQSKLVTIQTARRHDICKGRY